jgi:hypothetical protein
MPIILRDYFDGAKNPVLDAKGLTREDTPKNPENIQAAVEVGLTPAATFTMCILWLTATPDIRNDHRPT